MAQHSDFTVGQVSILTAELEDEELTPTERERLKIAKRAKNDLRRASLRRRTIQKSFGEKLNCLACGRPFVKKQYAQRFCNATCRAYFWNQKSRVLLDDDGRAILPLSAVAIDWNDSANIATLTTQVESLPYSHPLPAVIRSIAARSVGDRGRKVQKRARSIASRARKGKR